MRTIVDDGWFMIQESRLNLTYMDERTNDAAFDRYLRALARDIDGAPDEPRGVFYDTPTSSSIGAARRRALGLVLDARKEKLGRITAGYVMVTPSAVVRGVLTAVFWVAPPPYQSTIVGTAREGFEWLAARCAWLDSVATCARYEIQRRELLARMKPGAP